MDSLSKRFLEEADRLEGLITGMSDAIYRTPELGLKEFNTSGLMQDALKAAGYSIEADIAGMPTAFSARLGSGSPVVALLAEMDALPGIGHGCGHNIAGCASIGAGIALSKVLPTSGIQGTVLVLGTPAEELGKGKIYMLSAGVFKDVDAAMMVHGSSRRMVVKHFLGLIRLNISFKGRSSHASAYPEEGINALDAVIQTFNSISALRQQFRPDVRVHGIITDGGKAPNIIPDAAAASFYVRANDLRELESIKRRVIKCAEGAAISTGCTFQADESGELNAPMKINMAFIEAYRRILKMLNLPEDSSPPDKNVGSSDIGNVSQVCPTIHPHVPIMPGINIHTCDFADATITPDGHRALMEGVRSLGLTAIELFSNPSTLKAVKDDFAGPFAP